MIGQSFTVQSDGPLLKYLISLFPERSRTSVKNMLSKGQVHVNGETRTAFDQPLFPGDKVVILPKGISIARATREDAREEVESSDVKIVYEDKDYLIADNPSGLLTISTSRGSAAKSGKKEQTLYAILNAYVKLNARMQRKEDLISGQEPDRSHAKVWIVHRIDRGTSGLVVFAKNERAKDILQSRWKDLVIERKYIAYVEDRVEQEKGAIQSWLVENPKSLKVNSFPNEVPDGQLAITHYRVLGYTEKRQGTYTQMEFSLQTGRKNQIRVHCADIGHPIAGDKKYGAVTDPLRRLALHAATLVFRNPMSGKIVRLASPLPEVFERLER